jgi:hypothetical protein
MCHAQKLVGSGRTQYYLPTTMSHVSPRLRRIVPVPGQTLVTPVQDVERFLARSNYAELMGQAGGRRAIVGTP